MQLQPNATTDRGFERTLSAAGSVGLLAIALLGPSGVAVAIIAFAVLIVAVVGAPLGARGRRPNPTAPADEERWRAWRKVEPDPEFFRTGRRRRRAA